MNYKTLSVSTEKGKQKDQTNKTAVSSKRHTVLWWSPSGRVIWNPFLGGWIRGHNSISSVWVFVLRGMLHTTILIELSF